MKLSLYSIYDDQASHANYKRNALGEWEKEDVKVRGIWDVPFAALNDVNAKRHFFIVAKDTDTPIGQFTQAYSLYKIAEFDNETGELLTGEVELIMSGQELLDWYKHAMVEID